MAVISKIDIHENLSNSILETVTEDQTKIVEHLK